VLPGVAAVHTGCCRVWRRFTGKSNEILILL
jgi:hypothetical protein